MISAKDEFFMDRERLNEVNNLMNEADLSYDERQFIWDLIGDSPSEEAFEWAKRKIFDMQTDALTRVKNGEVYLKGIINKAVKRAADNE